MSAGFTYLPYQDTGYFSRMVTDYLNADDKLSSFYNYPATARGLSDAINERAKYPVNRKVLTDALTAQYASLTIHEAVAENIKLLSNENTFTVCTAHQPNLLTGYLYFIYKILHAIKLAEELNKLHPDKRFVPVYYMGSEDNDIEELGTFRYNGNRYVWEGDGQKGAVGRMKTAGLKPMLHELFRVFGPPGANYETLKKMLTDAYLKHDTIAEATLCLVNELFGRYGLIVLDPDKAVFKQEILPILKDDLLNQTANRIVTAQIEKLSVNYHAQAQPRGINLFYLTDGLRERIEKAGDRWQVVNTDIQWDEAQLLAELYEHPERFSPNVILRGIFQESILPDVAFIGGGSEVAYWMQLNSLFVHYEVFFPVVMLRQSVMWLWPEHTRLRAKLGLEIAALFETKADMERNYIISNTPDDWQTSKEAQGMEQIMGSLKTKAVALDATLTKSADAALARIQRQLQVLEKKMLRAEKQKMEVQMERIARLKAGLFPNNSLQERVENFTDYFLQYGYTFFDVLKEAMQPLNPAFLVGESD